MQKRAVVEYIFDHVYGNVVHIDNRILEEMLVEIDEWLGDDFNEDPEVLVNEFRQYIRSVAK